MPDFAKLTTGACLATCLAVAGAPALAVTLINGGFDEKINVAGKFGANLNDLSGSGTSSWDVFTSIPGWTSLGGSSGIEVQSAGTVPLAPHSPGYYVELDSHGNPGSNNSGMYQTVALSAGRYLLEFHYSPRVSGNPGDTNRIDFGVAANFAAAGNRSGPMSGFVSGPSAVTPQISVGTWTLISTVFDIIETKDYDLWFAAGGKDDSLGGFVDSVSLSVVPLPLGIVLLPFGFVAMHLVGRRLRAA